MTDDSSSLSSAAERLLFRCPDCGAEPADGTLFHIEVSAWVALGSTGQIARVDADYSEWTGKSDCICGRCQSCYPVDAFEDTYQTAHPTLHEPSAGLAL